jgi:hypothetical protein
MIWDMLPVIVFEYHLVFHSVSVRNLIMLDKEFEKDRARTVRDLAEKANDPFIKERLVNLASRYEDGRPRTSKQLTTLDLQFKSKGTGSER